MKRFFHKWLWALLRLPFVQAVSWTRGEQQAFDGFCKSGTGRKFLELLRQTVASTTFHAVYAEDSVSRNGYARGQQDLLALIYRLQSFPPPEEETEAGEEIEPLPSQKKALSGAAIDGRRLGGSAGHSAIFNSM